MKRILVTFLWAVLLAACGGGSAPPPPAPSEGSATIDEAGGTVTGPDGVALVVPPRAVATATTFRIARDGGGAPEVGGLKLISPIYAITPHGTEFGGSARVQIPFDASALAPGARPVLIKAQPGGAWTALLTDTVDGKVSAADTPGLSYYAVGTCWVSRDVSVAGPDPVFYCPAAHQLRLMLRDGSGTMIEAPRNASGVLQPSLTISAPTTLNVELNWTRPAGTARSDRVSLQLLGMNLPQSQQPLLDFPTASNDFVYTRQLSIDPATVPGAGNPGGKVIRLFAYAAYSTDAFYPGCACFQPATWSFDAELLVRVVYNGTQPTITSQPTNQAVSEGQTATFRVGASGPNLSYQWWRATGQTETPVDPSEGSGARSASHTTPATVFAHNNRLYYARVCSNAGTAQERCVNSNAALLTVAQRRVAPAFTTAPASITVTEGETVTLHAVASGEPAPTVSWARLRTVGQFTARDAVCTPRTGSGTQTSASCALGVMTLADSGSRYVAIASNTAAEAETPIATVTVLPRPVAPTLTSAGELADRSIVAGSSVSWSVGASGTAPISYAWYSTPLGGNRVGGIVCSGGASPGQSRNGGTLTLSNVPLACDGLRVEVVVSNAQGVATPAARIATLRVAAAPAAPTLTTGLQNRSVLDGEQVTFGVVATGTPSTFTYTWTLGGVPVASPVAGCTGTSASCTLVARLADSGKTMRVAVANGTAPDASSSAQLTVTTNDVPASITLQPADASTVEGGSASFTIAVAGTPTPTVTWQTSPDGTAWAGAGSGTTLSLTGLSLAQDGLRVRATVTNQTAVVGGLQTHTEVSRIATLTVAPPAPGMVIHAGDFTAGGGGGSGEGTGTSARFDYPEGLASDGAGNLFVANSNVGRISKVDAGRVVTFIGNMPQANQLALAPNGDLYLAGALNCYFSRILAPLATGAQQLDTSLNCPASTDFRGLAIEPGSGGSVIAYLSVQGANSIVRAVIDTSTPGSLGQTSGVWAGAPDPYQPVGSNDGPVTSARFNKPRGLARAANGDLYVADSGNHTIRRITPAGIVSTFAGTAGAAGTVDGTGAAARFHRPTDLAFDAAGNLVVLERGAESSPQAWVRRITPAGVVSTLFDATAEALALAAPGQQGHASNIKGLAVLDSRRIALSAGNAILVRTLP